MVWVIKKTYTKELAIKKGQQFLIFQNLNFINATIDIIRKSQEFMEKYNIKPRDAIHLSSAISKKLNEIITFDNDFKDIPIIKSNQPD